MRWSGIVRALCFLAPAAVALGAAACRPGTQENYDHLPVLMVHGLGDSRATYGELTAALRARGWPKAYLSAPSLQPSDGDNIAAAEVQLRAAAETLLARARRARKDGMPGPTRLIVVGHSMGALSARWFATRVSPEHVAALLTLAGANHGTNAFCDQPAPGPDDMCPAFAATVSESRIQAELNGTPASPRDETPYGSEADSPGHSTVPPDDRRRIAYLALRAEDERWITPDSSTRLDGASNEVFRNTDHDRIAREAGLAAIIDSLDQAVR
jgi:pimeloyl-ACP methyl ester carboxylesterase